MYIHRKMVGTKIHLHNLGKYIIIKMNELKYK